jgi:hypothetical protein
MQIPFFLQPASFQKEPRCNFRCCRLVDRYLRCHCQRKQHRGLQRCSCPSRSFPIMRSMTPRRVRFREKNAGGHDARSSPGVPVSTADPRVRRRSARRVDRYQDCGLCRVLLDDPDWAAIKGRQCALLVDAKGLGRVITRRRGCRRAATGGMGCKVTVSSIFFRFQSGR